MGKVALLVLTKFAFFLLMVIQAQAQSPWWSRVHIFVCSGDAFHGFDPGQVNLIRWMEYLIEDTITKHPTEGFTSVGGRFDVETPLVSFQSTAGCGETVEGYMYYYNLPRDVKNAPRPVYPGADFFRVSKEDCAACLRYLKGTILARCAGNHKVNIAADGCDMEYTYNRQEDTDYDSCPA